MARDGVLLLPTWFSRDLIDDVRLVFVFNAAFTVFIVLTVCLSSSSSYLFASKHNISTSIQKISEAGCQRGTNTHQCWPPSQLSDIIQVHKYTKKH